MFSKTMRFWHPLLPIAAALGGGFGYFSAMATDTQATPRSLRAYIGTYTGAKSKGIYLAKFDSVTGTLSQPVLATETPSPSFLAIHPNGRLLYAVNEIDDFQGRKSGSVSAYRIENGTGLLTLINQQPSGGSGPCHLAV